MMPDGLPYIGTAAHLNQSVLLLNFFYRKRHMKYDKIVKAIFIERPNRFIARVKIDGSEAVESVHVKNTGRCRGITAAGAEVILEDCIERIQIERLAMI